MPESLACNFIKKETLAQVFSCEFCEISKSIFFTEHLWAIVSVATRFITLDHISIAFWQTFRLFSTLINNSTLLKTLTQKTNPYKQNYKLSISMSGNIFKSATQVTALTGSFSNNLTLIVSLDTKKTFNLPNPSFFLHLCHRPR